MSTLSRIGMPMYLRQAKDGTPLCDKESPLAEILFRWDAYSKLARHALSHGVTPQDLWRHRYAFHLPEPEKPTIVSLELTNICDLRCTYCPIVDGDGRRKGVMHEQTFAALLTGLAEMKIHRVHVRGWGEPTLHPQFPDFMRRLAQVVPFIDIVTNAQWRNDAVIDTLVETPVHRIDISVDVGGREHYEATRVRGDYQRLIKNLQTLRAKRDERRSKSMIIVRSMFRPSQVEAMQAERAEWAKYADAVMPAPVFRKSSRHAGGELYTLTAASDTYPRCYFPFNELVVSWNGDVPLCDNLALGHDADEVRVGNVERHSLPAIWNGAALRRLRNAHKHGIDEDRPLCKGCPTC